MAPKRVLVVYPYLQHYRLGVFRAMDETLGIEYIFVSSYNGRQGIKALPPSSILNHIETQRTQIGAFTWQNGLLSVLFREHYDAVIFFAEIPAISTWIGALLARARQKSVLFWTTGWHRPESGIKRLFRNSFYRLSNQLLLYGNIGKAIGEQMNFPAERMTVIGNSVETSFEGTSLETEWQPQYDPATFVVGAVIRLIPEKQLDILIRAVSEIIHDDPSLKISVLIVGEGAERERLLKLADELNVELSLPGALYGSRALELVYEALDVTVVPGAIGLTAIQSMSHGVPVISHDSKYTQGPEWESIKPGVTGDLFQEGDLNGLIGALRKIIRLPEEKKDQLRLNCKNEVKSNWSAEAQAKKIEHAVLQCFPHG